MGTRSLITVWYKGRFIIAQYTQYDGYPEGQGNTILQFLSVKGNIELLKAGAEHIRYITNDEVVAIARRLREDKTARQRAGEMPRNDWLFDNDDDMDTLFPTLSRLTGGKILALVAQAKADKEALLTLDLEFANDSLFCEWAYCIDLDANVFEVFGAGTSKPASGSTRFNNVGAANAPAPTFIRSFPFDNLPKDNNEFVDLINKSINELQKIRREARGQSIEDDEDQGEEETEASGTSQ